MTVQWGQEGVRVEFGSEHSPCTPGSAGKYKSSSQRCVEEGEIHAEWALKPVGRGPGQRAPPHISSGLLVFIKNDELAPDTVTQFLTFIIKMMERVG